jgi:tellurite resistance protein TehA-like permease
MTATTASTARRPFSLARLAAATPVGAGAPVMGTGIVSVALASECERAAADALLVIAVAVAAAVASLLGLRARVDRAGLAREARAPASLTLVAALCVLGTRAAQAGGRAVGAVLLVCAVPAWAALLRAVLRRWRRPVRGDAFLVAVATQAIAVLCGGLGAGWLAVAAVAPLTAGVALYAFALAAFDRRELRRGRGDQWVAGGALAIAALAGATAASAAPGERLAGALATMSLVLWWAAMAWLPVLVVGEVLRPRAGFDARRWSTVFPVGMYAAMSHAVGEQAGRPWIVAFARDWAWVAVGVWALVAAASLGRAARLVALARTPPGGRRGAVRRPGTGQADAP